MRGLRTAAAAAVALVSVVVIPAGASGADHGPAAHTTPIRGVSVHQLSRLAGGTVHVASSRTESAKGHVYQAYMLGVAGKTLRQERLVVVSLGPSDAAVAVIRGTTGIAYLIDEGRVVRSGRATFGLNLAVSCEDVSQTLSAVDQACQNSDPGPPLDKACDVASVASTAADALCGIEGSNAPFSIQTAPVQCWGTGPTTCTWGGTVHVGDQSIGDTTVMNSCYANVGYDENNLAGGVVCYLHDVLLHSTPSGELGPGDYVFEFGDINDARTAAGDLILDTGYGQPWREYYGSKCDLSAAGDPSGGCAAVAIHFGFPLRPSG